MKEYIGENLIRLNLILIGNSNINTYYITQSEYRDLVNISLEEEGFSNYINITDFSKFITHKPNGIKELTKDTFITLDDLLQCNKILIKESSIGIMNFSNTKLQISIKNELLDEDDNFIL